MVSSILLIKLRHYGDVLLITPVINSLKRHYPKANIDVLLYAPTGEMLSADPYIRHIYQIDPGWKRLPFYWRVRHEWRLLQQLRGNGYELVLNLADQWRSGWMTRFTGAKKRIGFDFAKRRGALWRGCHTDLVKMDNHERQHVVEQNLSLLAPLALPDLCQQVTMSYSGQDWQCCQQQIPAQWKNQYIVIQPAARWGFKSCPPALISEVIRALVVRGYSLILSGGPDAGEQAMIDEIIRRCPAQSVLSLAGKLTLCQLAALIDHAQLFIGVDSVAMHMAAALQTPLIALFGASKLTQWHPWQVADAVIWAGEYGKLPDPDEVDTRTQQRYLSVIPPKVIIDAALRKLTP